MSILVGNLLVALGGVVSAVLSLAWGLLFARILFSWFRPDPPAGILRKLVGLVYALTDPVMDRTRRLLPFLQVGAFDLSPIALFFAIGFLQRVLAGVLTQWGVSMLA
ncbi:MAG: YggT family protein [Myxococcales bacterium]|nr:YggT family protein [Myxococcales bacterium]